MMVLCIFSLGCSESKKEVKAVVEEFPNYIFHLLTLGKIVPEDSEYISLYKEAISQKDQAFLNANRKLISWEDGSAGPLTSFFVFIPGYINFQSQGEITEYFDLLSKTVKTGNCEVFTRKYELYFNKMSIMFGNLDIKSKIRLVKKYSNVVTRLGRIYKNYYRIYHMTVWPQEKEKLEKTAKLINIEFQRRDLITVWENMVGLQFKTNDYQIVLFSANRNGPSANSLGYERNAFYYGQDVDHMVKFISHEVGTHLLIDDMWQVLQMNRFEYLDVYKAYENLAEFYNGRFIYDGAPMNMNDYDLKKYYQIYNDLYNSNQNITHKDLMIKGLEIYTSKKEG
jgi:hypothetical protein